MTCASCIHPSDMTRNTTVTSATHHPSFVEKRPCSRPPAWDSKLLGSASRQKGCVLTNCLLCSSLFFMNFRVLMVHDFSDMVAGVEAHQLLILLSQ